MLTVPLKKSHSQSIGKRKGKHQSLLRVKKLDSSKNKEFLANDENCIHKNFVQQHLVTKPTFAHINNGASNVSVKHSKRQPMASFNMDSSLNVEKPMSVENNPVFNQSPNRCCNQSRLKNNLNSMSTGRKMLVCRNEEDDILKRQLYQEDGFQQRKCRNVMINLHCGHENLDVTLNIYGCEHESEGTTDKGFATEWRNYEVLCGSKCYENGKQPPSCFYQNKCYFH